MLSVCGAVGPPTHLAGERDGRARGRPWFCLVSSHWLAAFCILLIFFPCQRQQGHPLALRSSPSPKPSHHPLSLGVSPHWLIFPAAAFYFSFGPAMAARGEEARGWPCSVFRSSLVLVPIGRPFLPTPQPRNGPQFVIGWPPARCLPATNCNSVPSLNAQTVSTFKRTHHLSNSQTSQHLQHAVQTAQGLTTT